MLQRGHYLRTGGVHLLVPGLSQFLADHHVGQLLPVGVGTVHGAHHLAQPQHGDAVRDMQHLAHLVADEYDALALADKLTHNGEQALHLDVGQGRGGLVQYQQLRAVVQRLQYLGTLLLAHGDLRNELVQLHIQAVALGQFFDLLAARRAVDEQPLGVLVAQDDVVENGHGLHQHEVLVHHADAQLHRLAGGLDAYLFALQENLSLRGLVQADENVHQRGLTGAVLAQQRQHLAAVDGQADVLVGVKIAEPLADVLHTQQLAQAHSLPSIILLLRRCSRPANTGKRTLTPRIPKSNQVYHIRCGLKRIFYGN